MRTKAKMLTLAQLIEQGYTTLSQRRLQQLVKAGDIIGATEVGGSWVVPLNKTNLKAITPKRKPKSPKSHNDVN